MPKWRRVTAPAEIRAQGAQSGAVISRTGPAPLIGFTDAESITSNSAPTRQANTPVARNTLFHMMPFRDHSGGTPAGRLPTAVPLAGECLTRPTVPRRNCLRPNAAGKCSAPAAVQAMTIVAEGSPPLFSPWGQVVPGQVIPGPIHRGRRWLGWLRYGWLRYGWLRSGQDAAPCRCRARGGACRRWPRRSPAVGSRRSPPSR